MSRDFLSIDDLTPDELAHLLDLAAKVKADPASILDAPRGQGGGHDLRKPSTRTRVSFEVAISSIGASSRCTSTPGAAARTGRDDRGHRRGLSPLRRRDRPADVRPGAARASGRGGRRPRGELALGLRTPLPVPGRPVGRSGSTRASSPASRSPTSATGTTWRTRCSRAGRCRHARPRCHAGRVRADPPGRAPCRGDRRGDRRLASRSRTTRSRPSTGADVLYTDVWASLGQEARPMSARSCSRRTASTAQPSNGPTST